MLKLRRDEMLFPGGREKAFTLSYDDGVYQDEKLVNLLEQYGVQGTFNLNSGLFGNKDWLSQPGIEIEHYKFDYEQIPVIYGDHELAVHSLTHLDLAKVPVHTIAYQIIEDKKNLEKILRHPVRGMAYPFGMYTEETKKTAKTCGMAYARTTQSTGGFRIPDDFLNWHPTCHHNDRRMELIIKEFLDDASLSNGVKLFLVWGHSYEFEAYSNWSKMEKLLDRVAQRTDTWYASNIEIYDYVQSYRRLIYSATGEYICNPGIQEVWLLTGDEKYCIPPGETIQIVEGEEKC